MRLDRALVTRHMAAYLIKTLPELRPGVDYSAHDLAATANAYSRAKIWDERLFRWSDWNVSCRRF
jgi:hypothetical protein